MVVRRGRALPFESEEDSMLHIITGMEAGVEEMVGSTIPDSWKAAADHVLAGRRPCTVMVMGDVDSGKTTFSTFLVNRALASSSPKVALIDADIGQADIGPPTTMGLTLIQKPITELFALEAEAIFFAGITNPSRVVDRVLLGLRELKRRAEAADAEFVVVNTDGWVQGVEAKDYKLNLAKEVSASIIVGLQLGDELEDILNAMKGEGLNVLRLSSSPVVKRRDREERKRLREQGYRKFLEGNALRTIPLSWVKLEYAPPNAGKQPSFGKEEELGLLVGLLDQERRFVGLGVILEIDCANQVLRVYTPYTDKVSVVQFGQVRVDRNGKELGLVNANQA